jgi:hypothetical protein
MVDKNFLHFQVISSVERRTINDQEATDTILVHGVFIMFFFIIAIDIQL